MGSPPIPQGPAPLLNRSWVRRGWASPAPYAASVAPIMAETTVTIERRTLVADDLGGYRAGDWAVVYVGPAHVEHFEETKPKVETSGEMVQVIGVALYHHYEAYMAIPDDPAQMPAKRDRMTFSDGYEVHVHPVMHVELNAGLTDHIEIWTDEFEV